MNTNSIEETTTFIPDTPYFRAGSLRIAPEAQSDLEQLRSGGEGSLFINGIYPVNLYYNYGMLLGDAVSVSFEYLARKTKSTLGEVRRYLESICQLGLLREDCIDSDARIMYFTKAAARLQFVEYCIDENGRETVLDRPPEIWEAQYDDPASRVSDAGADNTNKDVIENGSKETFAQLVRRYNDALPDPEITAVLDETERLLVLLSDTVKNMPSQNRKLNDVTEKYLPQLEKLLQTYQNYHSDISDNQTVNNIRTMIVDAVHMFNMALRQLTNDLLSDAELEISRLRFMLERDGLLKGAFSLS